MWNRDGEFLRCKMKLFVFIYFCVARDLPPVLGVWWDMPTLGSTDNPRILIRGNAEVASALFCLGYNDSALFII